MQNRRNEIEDAIGKAQYQRYRNYKESASSQDSISPLKSFENLSNESESILQTHKKADQSSLPRLNKYNRLNILTDLSEQMMQDAG